MPTGIRRNFFAVESSLIDNVKWMRLTWEERGKWLAVRCLAERQPTAEFRSADHLAILLRKEGDNDPEATIARLIEARLLDLNDDGRVSIHDADDYKPPTSTERVKRHRETDRNGPKRRETATDRQTYIHAGPSATGAGPRERTEGETLKQFLDRIGAPIPEIATAKETMNGKTDGPESRSDDDGKSRRRTRRRATSSG